MPASRIEAYRLAPVPADYPWLGYSGDVTDRIAEYVRNWSTGNLKAGVTVNEVLIYSDPAG